MYRNNRFKKMLSLFLSAGLVAMLFSGTGVALAEVTVAPPQFTSLAQVGDHVKLEWAMEMPAADVITSTSFESGEETPDLSWSGSYPLGRQSVASAPGGGKALKLLDIMNTQQGNLVAPPAVSSVYSIHNYAGKRIPNDTNLSINYKMYLQSGITGNTLYQITAGWGSKGYPLLDNSGKAVKFKNTFTFYNGNVNSFIYVQVDSGSPSFTQGQSMHIATSKGTDYDYNLVRCEWDSARQAFKVMEGYVSTTTPLGRPFLARSDTFYPGEAVLTLKQSEVTLERRHIFETGKWVTVSSGLKTPNDPGFNLEEMGVTVRQFWQTDGTLFMDDVKIGYSPETELIRDGESIYKGYESNYDDASAKDVTAPAAPTVTLSLVAGKPNATWTAVEDRGTTYTYQLKGKPRTGAETNLSEPKQIIMKSGFKGYSIVIDQNPDTIPLPVVNTTNTVYTSSTVMGGNFYAHLAAIDNNGNISDVVHTSYLDIVGPEITISADKTAWTKETVKLYASVTDTESGVKQIQTPDGLWHAGSSVDYTVNENGEYKFAAEDIAGNITEKSFVVTNIDHSPPVIIITPDGRSYESSDIDVRVKYTDEGSGVFPTKRWYKVTSSEDLPLTWDEAEADEKDITILSEGKWFVHAKAEDTVGNMITVTSKVMLLQKIPETPQLRLNSFGENSAVVSWDLPATTFPEGYTTTVENITTGKTWTVEYPLNSILDEQLSGGSAYQYHAYTVNNVGASNYSNSLQLLTLPAAPEGLVIEPVENDSSQATVIFQPVPSAEQYFVTIKDLETDLSTEHIYTEGGNHLINGLKPGKQYSISVKANNESGKGQAAIIGYLSLPAAPGEFKAVIIKETEIELNWLPSETASSYELIRGNESVFSGPELSYMDFGLESATEYDYQLAAKNASGFGDIAVLDKVLTLPGKLDLQVNAIRASEVDLNWTSVYGADKYVLVVNGVEEELPKDAEHYTLKYLDPGKPYLIEIAAVNRSGSGAPGVSSIITLPDQVVGLQISDIGETTAKLQWDLVEGADKYRITIHGEEYEVSGKEMQLTDLMAGENYEVIIAAGNASGYGAEYQKIFLTLPGAPNGIKLVNAKSNEFAFSWDEVKSATVYKIYNVHNEQIGLTSVPHFTVTGIHSGAITTVYVAALNNTGEGNSSSFTQCTLPAWHSVNPITIGDSTEHSIVINWEPVEGADVYKIVNEKGETVGIVKSPETSAEVGGLNSATDYKDWTIVPSNEAGDGEAATIPPFVTKPSSDFTPVITAQQNELKITVEGTLQGEIIVISQNSKEIYSGEKHEITVKNLAAGTSYTFEVWTENSIKDKSLSKTVTGLTLATPVNYTDDHSDVKEPVKGKDEEGITELETPDASLNGERSNFQDIDNVFARKEILALYDKGIVKGVSDTLYAPNNKVTRVEFASMLVRAMELQEASGEALTFEDIQRTAWYVPELNTAILQGVAKGFSDKLFKPNDSITREQASKMIANTAYQGVLPPNDRSFAFKDARIIAAWAKLEVAVLSEAQVIQGYPDGSFKPQRDLTRAECAALIYRALPLLGKTQ